MCVWKEIFKRGKIPLPYPYKAKGMTILPELRSLRIIDF